MASLLKLEKVSKEYDGERALHDVSLELKEGEVVSIIGPSGSGKTTLLRCVAGLENIEAGSIFFAGADANMNGDQIGFVFQDLSLWPHKTVLENITEALVKVRGKSVEQANEIGLKLLSRFGLVDKKDVYPENLSTGQQQRVAVARTLAVRPKMIMFDEITSALDPELVGEVLKIIKQLARDGMTMLVVTHHMRFAKEISDRIIFLDKGEIVEENTSQGIFSAPVKERTRKFLNAIIEV